jgi:hypothetical protein
MTLNAQFLIVGVMGLLGFERAIVTKGKLALKEF